MNLCNIEKTFELKAKNNWDTLYVLLDLHGPVILSHSHDTFQFITEDCIEVLRWFSKRKDFRIILWTSSYVSEIEDIIKWLSIYEIDVDYVNCNPECKNTKKADFHKKPYFNICIDDKAGFEPLTDWKEIKKLLIVLKEWDKV
jgi:hypothetical protein